MKYSWSTDSIMSHSGPYLRFLYVPVVLCAGCSYSPPAEPMESIQIFDAGVVFADSTPLISHTFQLKNDSIQPIDIVEFTPLCACTDAKIDRATIAPGEFASVAMSVHVTPADSEQSADCIVRTTDTLKPVQVMRVIHRSPPRVRCEPNPVTFGPFGIHDCRHDNCEWKSIIIDQFGNTADDFDEIVDAAVLEPVMYFRM
jgi:hypothetical protein